MDLIQPFSSIRSIVHRKRLRAILAVVIVVCVVGMLSLADLPSAILFDASSSNGSSNGDVTSTTILRLLPSAPPAHLDQDAHLGTKDRVTPSYTAFLEARQSKTLEEAVSKYRLKYDREPPQHFDNFVSFALNHKCLVDEYDQIHRDLAPFRKMNATVFKRRVRALLNNDAVSTYSVKNGVVEISQTTYLNSAWDPLIAKLAPDLPDVDVTVNALDEPRVLLNNVRNIMNTEDFNDIHGLLIAPDSVSYTYDLYPVLSQTKIHPCFSDIIVPPIFYASVSPSVIDNVPWEQKESKLFWRGSTSGGHAVDGNWRQMHRQRFMLLARNRSDTDVGFTHIIQCDQADCESQQKEFSTVPSEPWEEHIKHKWLFDTDGNSFSGRFTRLLRSKSLVFKATIMTEYFSDWLKPYIHYVPISLSYDDLDAKLKWAAENDELAKSIAEEGSRMSTRYLRPQDMECYTLHLLTELAHLQHQPDP
ncbi:hypothetical protein SeMB42_g00552 [Synchytrium endobioticum]|uniref:Glycosyl transferase CAP10 domain-containing protein n=1 Tax=Synchytrium endobioticum TaxID=286115 RepID=A0A507DSH7_9FUNG|nr:hypothetical protein SeLEV6574_g01166 [Synchytrium endobioticum]TPX53918.1 hypothetical protein SeMB42_g00552 [Synchytrium endobioticum]